MKIKRPSPHINWYLTIAIAVQGCFLCLIYWLPNRLLQVSGSQDPQRFFLSWFSPASALSLSLVEFQLLILATISFLILMFRYVRPRNRHLLLYFSIPGMILFIDLLMHVLHMYVLIFVPER